MQNDVKKLIKDLSALYGKYAGSDEFKLLLSALVEHNPLNSTQEIAEWLKELNSKQFFQVEEIDFAAMKQWSFNPQNGDLCHASGKFFSISGMEIYNDLDASVIWDQPVIDQPEIGVLGILCKEMDGILYCLMQAKAEPGNLNTYQLSPTVQATRSNYLQVHGGRKTKFLDYFNDQRKVRVVLDQFQSEQGARFFNKRNRNILVICDEAEEIETGDNHRWISLGQLKSLMEQDNAVNMDSRSIISMIDYRVQGFMPDQVALMEIISEYRGLIGRSDFWLKTIIAYLAGENHSIAAARNALSWRRYYHPNKKRKKGLAEVRDWQIGERSIEHKSNKYFQVLAVKVSANNREVDAWDQPIIRQRHHGSITLLAKDGAIEPEFLIQAKHEPGLYDMIEFAPTVQCIAENYEPESLPAYYGVIDQGKSVYAAYQSEEGGRFYQESSLNQIRIMDDEPELKSGFNWLSLDQLKKMVQYQQMLNVELRSLLAYF